MSPPTLDVRALLEALKEAELYTVVVAANDITKNTLTKYRRVIGEWNLGRYKGQVDTKFRLMKEKKMLLAIRVE